MRDIFFVSRIYIGVRGDIEGLEEFFWVLPADVLATPAEWWIVRRVDNHDLFEGADLGTVVVESARGGSLQQSNEASRLVVIGQGRATIEDIQGRFGKQTAATRGAEEPVDVNAIRGVGRGSIAHDGNPIIVL
ncbi:hypothetical protein HYQ46_008027 [Verticillium longisporum]|nr:hypothetical protein HYQ46_008027 [Verticillium longisporum]